MPRLAFLASLAALAMGAAAASAQESGGVALTPEVFATENAQGQVLDHVLARAQQLQQLRVLNLSGGAVASSNLANPAFTPPNGDPQAIGAGQAGALALAAALRRRAARASDPAFQQQIINNTQSLTVNASNSPVTIGDNNVVKQQVTSSTATTTNGNATATAGASNTSYRHGEGKGKAKSGQTAVSNAASLGGGTAQAVAINSDVRPQADR
jgi:hypothetical protein